MTTISSLRKRRSGTSTSREPVSWRRGVTAPLIALGGILAAVTFFGVLSMPDLAYHPARDAELRASYSTYLETGVPLVKENGTGSWYGAVEGEGLTRAAGDDDPGTYLVAAWMSHLTGSNSPYPGLRWVMALLCSLPLLILPVTVARLFGRITAGFAVAVLPLVMWILNRSLLVGTEYGLRDSTASTPVYALYGMAASMVFLSLVVLTFLSTRRLGTGALVAVTVGLVALASVSNLLRSLSGLGIALGAGVLWWLSTSGKRRIPLALLASVFVAAAATVVPNLVMDRIDAARLEVISPEASAMTVAHGTWHAPYIGLSYPQPITGEPSTFGIVWSDEFGWNKAREVDRGVRIGSAEYDAILKDLYLEQIRSYPVAALRLYAAKTLFTIQHFSGLILLVVLGIVLSWRFRIAERRMLAAAVAIALPTLLWGLVPPVLGMPLLYYYSEFIAALGLLSAVALGGIASILLSDRARSRATAASVESHSVPATASARFDRAGGRP